MAAREGSLRDLQAALDRRKFSTAKDDISPKGEREGKNLSGTYDESFLELGTTPLHVAVIFGHTGESNCWGLCMSNVSNFEK